MSINVIYIHTYTLTNTSGAGIQRGGRGETGRAQGGTVLRFCVLGSGLFSGRKTDGHVQRTGAHEAGEEKPDGDDPEDEGSGTADLAYGVQDATTMAARVRRIRSREPMFLVMAVRIFFEGGSGGGRSGKPCPQIDFERQSRCGIQDGWKMGRHRAARAPHPAYALFIHLILMRKKGTQSGPVIIS